MLMSVRKTIEMPSQYKAYVFDSMHGSDAPGIHLDFTEHDGTMVTVKIPVTPDLINRLRDVIGVAEESE